MLIEVIKGDILKIRVEAIVNPSNPQLLRRGGLYGLIHKYAGEELFQYLKDWKRTHKRPALNFGEAILSPSFYLPHKYIIHAVGAVWHGGNNDESDILKQCYINILNIAAAHNIRTLSIPNISTGIYGYPKQQAAEVALETLFTYQKETSIEQVFVVCYDEKNFDINKSLLVAHKKC